MAPYEFLLLFDDYAVKTSIRKDVKAIITTIAPNLNARPNVNRLLEE